jgi:hypothetical protein
LSGRLSHSGKNVTLRVLESAAMRRILGLKKEEVTRDRWGTGGSIMGEAHDLYPLEVSFG